MKIAIASSGLGHVQRGMEAWSEDIARALFETGVDVTLFKGWGKPSAPYEVVLPTFRRKHLGAKLIGKLTSKGGWRIGLGSPHAVESFFFGIRLIPKLRKDFDLIHVQQGSLGIFLLRTRKLGFHSTPVILANGQSIDSSFLSLFRYVQHLSPLREGTDESTFPANSQRFVIPNFIDTNIFRPGEKKTAKKFLGLPENKFVVSTAGLFNNSVKRIDLFIQEMAQLLQHESLPLHFAIAGASDIDTQMIMKMADHKLGKNVSFFLNLAREKMPFFFNASDIFTLCSPKEAFGTVVIEAMSCGVPVVTQKYPVLEWVVQKGGCCVEMKREGNLCNTVGFLCRNDDLRKKIGAAGRQRVKAFFSREAVLEQILDMYDVVLKEKG